jgi:hypothetical protein
VLEEQDVSGFQINVQNKEEIDLENYIQEMDGSYMYEEEET